MCVPVTSPMIQEGIFDLTPLGLINRKSVGGWLVLFCILGIGRGRGGEGRGGSLSRQGCHAFVDMAVAVGHQNWAIKIGIGG